MFRTFRRGRTGAHVGSGLTLLAGLLLAPATPPAEARPAEYMLEALNFGSRTDLGLGGDPFPSALAGEAGWWDQDLFEASRSIGLRQVTAAPLTGRLTSGSGYLNRVFGELFIQQGWKRSGRNLHLGLVAAWAGVRNEVRSDLSRLGLEEKGTAYRGMARLSSLVPGLDLQAEVPLGQTSSLAAFPFRYGFRYTFHERLFLQAHRSTSGYSPSLVGLLESESLEMPLNLAVDEFHYGVGLRLLRTLTVATRGSETRFEPVRGVTDVFSDEVQPDGLAIFREYEAVFGQVEGWRGVVRNSRLDVHAEAAGYWGGEQYLRLSHGGFEMDSWLMGLQLGLRSGHRLFLDWTLGDFAGTGRAAVDSWRFVSWKESWGIGSKVARATLDGDWDRHHVGYERHGTRSRFRAGFSWYEIRPHALVDTWIKPVIGKLDEEHYTLESDRYSLAAVSLGGAFQAGSVEISLGLHQFVYGNDHLDHTAKPDPGSDSGRRAPGWYGGTFAELRMAYRL